jgi:hypothetical protein
VRLFIFESNVKTGLRAFVGDVAGQPAPMLVLRFAMWDDHRQQCEATRGTAYLSIDIRPCDAGCMCSAFKSCPNASREAAEHNNLSHDTIEEAISAHGFQLWRVKPKMA